MADARAKPAPRWLAVTILVITGVFYSYAVWNAVAFLVDHAASGLSGYGWFVLLFAVVFPLLAFGVVYVIGFKRSAVQLLLAALAGLGVVAVFWLNVLAHYAASLPLFTP